MWGDVPDIVTRIKFDVDRFRDFRSMRVQNRGVPLTRRVALTKVLHYRANCDISHAVLVWPKKPSFVDRFQYDLLIIQQGLTSWTTV